MQAEPELMAWLGILCAAGIVVANAMLLGGGAIPAVVLWTIAASLALARNRSADSPSRPA